MSTIFASKQAQRAYESVRAQNPDLTDAEAVGAAEDLLDHWEYEAACERAEHGWLELSPSLENCDDWGTGEGRYHGRV